MSPRTTINAWIGSGLLLLSSLGCQTPGWFQRKPAEDPFLQQTRKEGATRSTTMSGVQQASYDDPNSEVIDSTIRPPDAEGWERFNAQNLSKTWKKAIGRGPELKIARPAYEKGKQLFAEKKYAEAAPEFATAVDRWPDSTLEEDAMFYLGESYFFADQYVKAEDAYQSLVEKYSNTRYLDLISKRLFSIAKYWQDLYKSRPESFYSVNATDNTKPWYDTIGHASRVYEKIRLNDPRGMLADDAIIAAANIKMELKEYDEADHLYGVLRSDYPRSEHQLAAHRLGLWCKLMMYQGADYDEKPLKDAEQLVDQLLVQFPQELPADERDRLKKIKAEINFNRAMRDWNTAQYYEKGDYARAARFYYQKVIREYPNTELANKSKERIAAIANMPDNPPNNFEFLDTILGPPNGYTGATR
jgi:TolA-binding protein